MLLYPEAGINLEYEGNTNLNRAGESPNLRYSRVVSQQQFFSEIICATLYPEAGINLEYEGKTNLKQEIDLKCEGKTLKTENQPEVRALPEETTRC